jgi:hypothetical protein
MDNLPVMISVTVGLGWDSDIQGQGTYPSLGLGDIRAMVLPRSLAPRGDIIQARHYTGPLYIYILRGYIYIYI